jgi:hypothetical protein
MAQHVFLQAYQHLPQAAREPFRRHLGRLSRGTDARESCAEFYREMGHTHDAASAEADRVMATMPG